MANNYAKSIIFFHRKAENPHFVGSLVIPNLWPILQNFFRRNLHHQEHISLWFWLRLRQYQRNYLKKSFMWSMLKKNFFSSINDKVLNKLELVTGGPLDFL